MTRAPRRGTSGTPFLAPAATGAPGIVDLRTGPHGAPASFHRSRVRLGCELFVDVPRLAEAALVSWRCGERGGIAVVHKETSSLAPWACERVPKRWVATPVQCRQHLEARCVAAH